MIYKVCPACGAHLDPGEQCDCQVQNAEVKERANDGDV